MSVRTTQPVSGWPITRTPGNVAYPRVLSGESAASVRSITGVVIALAGYGLVVPVVAQVILAIAWAARGRPESFATYYTAAMAYQYPEGMLAAHAGLAMLIPVSLLVVRYVHGRSTRFLHSVQPGMRWRYLLVAAVAAVVVLNAVLWVSRIGTATTWAPQRGVGWWLLLIVVTSPWQAAAEEYFFRGYLMQALGSIVPNPWFGVVTSALVFAIFHGVQNPALFVDRFGFGLLAGTLVLVTGGLEAGIAAHVVNNIFAFGYAALMGGVATARGVTTITWAGAGWDLLGFALFGAVAWWLGRRFNLATTTPAAAVVPGLGVGAAIH